MFIYLFKNGFRISTKDVLVVFRLVFILLFSTPRQFPLIRGAHLSSLHTRALSFPMSRRRGGSCVIIIGTGGGVLTSPSSRCWRDHKPPKGANQLQNSKSQVPTQQGRIDKRPKRIHCCLFLSLFLLPHEGGHEQTKPPPWHRFNDHRVSADAGRNGCNPSMVRFTAGFQQPNPRSFLSLPLVCSLRFPIPDPRENKTREHHLSNNGK